VAAVAGGAVERFVARCVDAVAGPHAAGAIERDLRQLVARPDHVLRALPGDGAEETVLHRSPTLTVVRVDGPPGLAFPPHDHRMPALVGILAGEETNTYYRVGDDGLRTTRAARVARGDVLRLGADVVHAISNAGADRSIGIHVYLGDLFGTARSIWHPDTHERQPYSTSAYLALARPAGAHPPAERP
jgi:predicted metal-dependent enzyme (double-stranded beta helix superfamily)